MKKILLLSILLCLALITYTIADVYYRISQGVMTSYGHLILRDREGILITDKGRSGGYVLPYQGSLENPVVESILQIEDARFYEHSGVNLRAKIASLYQNLGAGAIVRGGSTITEQYMKNAYYPGAPRTLMQKIREAIGAMILETKYTKDEILIKYLSSVYMGNGLYGIETNTLGNTDDDSVLDTLTKLRYPNISLTESGAAMEYRARLAERLGKQGDATRLFDSPAKNSIDLFPILTTRADAEITRYCHGQENTLTHWTKSIPSTLCDSPEENLTLTIDAHLMQRASEIARGTLKSLESKHVTNAAVYIIHPEDNTILAYIGSANPTEQIDMATRRRTVGSLLKPFIYLFALRSGADSEDYLLDDKTSYETSVEGKYFVPENYNPKSYGPIRLREALGNSLNAATVRLTSTLGITNVYDELRKAGLSLDRDAAYYGYGISLGTVETSLENIVDSYRYLTNLHDPDIWQIGQILSDPRNRARTFGISSILGSSIPMSVKTGTSTDFRDNWTVSYNPDAIIGVWVGNSDGSPMGDVSGVTGAGPIWHQIAEYMISRGMIRPHDSPPPPGLHQVPICLDTACFRKEMTYTRKSESPQSRPAEGLYFRSDFFGDMTTEEAEKWGIQ